MKSFPPFQLDTVNQCLWREGARVPLTPKAFDVLRFLVEHAGRLVTQDELLEALWPETYVQPEVLRKYILEIRKALADNPGEPRFVATLPKRGYQFIAQVGEENSSAAISSRMAETFQTLVGREAALAQLHSHLQKTMRGQRQIVFVTGEAGVGKTSLVDAFQYQTAFPTNARIARGQCVEGFGGKEPYYPVLEALSQLLRDTSDDSVLKILAAQAPTWLMQFPALLKSDQREALQREILGATRERMVREICEALEKFTAEHALLLILEDLHWVDPSTLDFLSAVARRRSPAKLLIVGTYRPVDVILSQSPLKLLKQDLLIHHLCDELALERLQVSDVAKYLVQEFSGHEFPSGLAPLIHRHSDGNALFMAAIVEHMAKKGMISREDGTWRLHGAVSDIDPGIPETLHEMLEMQFDPLSATEQRILKCGSVAGERFSAWAVSAMLGRDSRDVQALCEELSARHQFIRPAGSCDLADGSITESFDFRHALHREFLYKRLAANEKQQFHQRLAERTEALCSPPAPQLASELALHFEAGRDFERAIHYSLISFQNLAQRCAHRASIELLQHALELLPNLAPQAAQELELRILRRISDAHYALGEMALCAEVGENAAVRAERAGLPAMQVYSLIDLSRPYSFLNPDRAIELSERAAEIAARLDDPLLAARTQLLAACWRILMKGWQKKDSSICHEAAKQIQTLRGADFQVYGEVLYAHVLGSEGEYQKSFDYAASAIPQLVESRNLVVYLSALSSQAYALLHMGRWGEALQSIATGIETSEKNDNGPWREVFSAYRSWLHLLAFDVQAARHLSEALMGTGTVLGGTLATVIAGFSELVSGNPDQALRHFQHTRSPAMQKRFVMYWYWQMMAQLGLCDAWMGKHDLIPARQEAEGFLQAARSTADPALQALASEANARVALAFKDEKRAASCIEDALVVLKNREIPVIAWRVHATAMQLFRTLNDDKLAEKHRLLAKANILQLADSLKSGDPLRNALLSAVPLRAILETREAPAASRSRGKDAVSP